MEDLCTIAEEYEGDILDLEELLRMWCWIGGLEVETDGQGLG